MGILDEAIREHLELKRQHGADDSELKQLEDQAFGQSERPGAEEQGPTWPRRRRPSSWRSRTSVTRRRGPTLRGGRNQEPPPVRREPAAGMADIQEPPAKHRGAGGAGRRRGGAGGREEEQPSRPRRSSRPANTRRSPSRERPEPLDRRAPRDRRPADPDVRRRGGVRATEAPAPPDEELVAEEIDRAAARPRRPALGPTPEQGGGGRGRRLLRRAAPLRRARPGARGAARPEPSLRGARAGAEPEPASSRSPTRSPQHDRGARGAARRQGHGDEDVLEETPDFLEETPEDDELWFEQKPPKDFDFDD